jgi:hypothetical protein
LCKTTEQMVPTGQRARLTIAAIAALLMLTAFSVPKRDGKYVLHKMYHRYHGHWQRSVRFIQQTERFINDTVTTKETWYETIVYPRSFRIDLGEPDQRNCVIYRNDSAYVFRKGALSRSRVDSNDLLYLLGGMYHASSLNDVTTRLAAMHYDLSKSYYTRWRGRDIYVIGAAGIGDRANQLWVESKHYRIVRIMKFDNGMPEEILMEGHKRLGHKKWTETRVAFYRSGRLLQLETYSDIVVNDEIDERIFDPAAPWQWHWYAPGNNQR